MDRTRFRSYAWGSLALTVAVIAGGAVVRATGSGAGCGSSWPRCDGDLVPFSAGTETMIEFAHRATSGLAFIAVALLAWWARRLWPRRHAVRRAAAAALAFMVGEVLIGALLVTREWVGDDASVARAVVDGAHLVNTLFLLGALTLVAWWARSDGEPMLRWAPVSRRLSIGLGLLLVVAAAGALTALGDTLFPDAGVAADFDNSSHFLVRLRIIHPVLAVATAAYLVAVLRPLAHRPAARAAGILVIGQIGLGVINFALGAPLWLQVAHLLVADMIWIALVITTEQTMRVGERQLVSS